MLLKDWGRVIGQLEKSYLKKHGLSNTRMPIYWIEKTIVKGHPDRVTGEYALGRALWSPQRGKGGADIYRFLRDVQPGDVILHFTDNTAITAISQVETTYREFKGLPGTDLFQDPTYVVKLHNFIPLDPLLTREMIFTSPYSDRLITLINSGIKNLFYNRELNLNQGAYLTPVPLELITILNDAYQEQTGKTLLDISSTAPSLQPQLDFELEEPQLIPTSTFSEKEFLEHVKKYIAAKGYYFDDETVFNYHICLKTRPFVILAGLSGTGKSKLAQLYAEALGHTKKSRRYLRLPVRPSWNDDRYLLGYLNTLTGDYVTEPAVEFLMQAGSDKDNLYFFCLDEMNLAHVEYYFSQFLSAMEEDNPDDREIILFSARAQAHLPIQNKTQNLSRSVLIPTNLLFTGTVNVDETTQPLSDKVMDRANTIEFFAVELDKIPEPEPSPQPIQISATDWHKYQSWQPDKTYRSDIISIAKILQEGDMGIGYRVVRDIELYLANSQDLLNLEVAFDLQVKQRILPHVRGTKTIETVLSKLLEFLSHNSLVRSAERLQEMKIRLERDGYVNFWR